MMRPIFFRRSIETRYQSIATPSALFFFVAIERDGLYSMAVRIAALGMATGLLRGAGIATLPRFFRDFAIARLKPSPAPRLPSNQVKTEVRPHAQVDAR